MKFASSDNNNRTATYHRQSPSSSSYLSLSATSPAKLTMVKAKELKVLRKALDQYRRSTLDPLDALLISGLVEQHQRDDKSSNIDDVDNEIERVLFRNTKFRITTTASRTEESAMSNQAMIDLSVSTTITRQQGKEDFTVKYYRTLPNYLLPQCLDIFINNMKELYETSAWGYDIDEKQKELQHPNARFIVISVSSIESEPDSINNDTIVAFIHFRYCYDNDDDPTMLVLYIYEMQVQVEYQKQGVGQYCMHLMELIAKQSGTTTSPPTSSATKAKENKATVNQSSCKNKNSQKKKSGISVLSEGNNVTTTTIATPCIQKIMLTVFRQNTSAMQFYRSKLHYMIDATSPSQYNQITDYEILSKPV